MRVPQLHPGVGSDMALWALWCRGAIRKPTSPSSSGPRDVAPCRPSRSPPAPPARRPRRISTTAPGCGAWPTSPSHPPYFGTPQPASSKETAVENVEGSPMRSPTRCRRQSSRAPVAPSGSSALARHDLGSAVISSTVLAAQPQRLQEGTDSATACASPDMITSKARPPHPPRFQPGRRPPAGPRKGFQEGCWPCATRGLSCCGSAPLRPGRAGPEGDLGAAPRGVSLDLPKVAVQRRLVDGHAFPRPEGGGELSRPGPWEMPRGELPGAARPRRRRPGRGRAGRTSSSRTAICAGRRRRRHPPGRARVRTKRPAARRAARPPPPPPVRGSPAGRRGRPLPPSAAATLRRRAAQREPLRRLGRPRRRDPRAAGPAPSGPHRVAHTRPAGEAPAGITPRRTRTM